MAQVFNFYKPMFYNGISLEMEMSAVGITKSSIMHVNRCVYVYVYIACIYLNIKLVICSLDWRLSLFQMKSRKNPVAGTDEYMANRV